jgi:methyl-accepting chemotaxis protein
MQQVSSSVKNVSGLAQKTVDALMENFKVSEESKNTQSSFAKPQNFDRKKSSKMY